MTHGELVDVAAKWLSKTCAVVVTELATSCSEQPDAIGWNGWHSTLVECKASRSDFKADASKFFRIHPESGVGQARYFLAVSGLIQVSELPPNWGLIEVGKKVKVAHKSGVHTVDNRSEIALLLSVLRRVGSHCPQGVSIKCYAIPTGNRSTLGFPEFEAVNDGEGI